MAAGIPFNRLGIPQQLRSSFGADAPRSVKLAMARGLVPTTTDVQLAICYILSGDDDEEIAEAAADSIAELPAEKVVSAITMRTHPKILEFLAEVHPASEVDARVAMHRMANDRTVRRIARRAGKDLCERLVNNHERLLMTPDVIIDLHANPHCTDRDLERSISFMRMQKVLPELPEERPYKRVDEGEATAKAAAPPPEKPAMDLEAEVLAAIAGEQSPSMLQSQQQQGEMGMFEVDDVDLDLGDFEFSFEEEMGEISFLLTEEVGDGDRVSPEDKASMEAMIRDMSPGQKIKLAYLGNQEARAILLRDTNKLVASAVVKSGRMNESEALSAAGNRNLNEDVIREIANNREYTRKYPFQVALVNNPKCPPSVAMGFVRVLNRRDLQALSRNRNVPSVVTSAANRLFREKYRR